MKCNTLLEHSLCFPDLGEKNCSCQNKLTYFLHYTICICEVFLYLDLLHFVIRTVQFILLLHNFQGHIATLMTTYLIPQQNFPLYITAVCKSSNKGKCEKAHFGVSLQFPHDSFTYHLCSLDVVFYVSRILLGFLWYCSVLFINYYKYSDFE